MHDVHFVFRLYWSRSSDFADGACGAKSSAADLGYDEQDVINAFNEVHGQLKSLSTVTDVEIGSYAFLLKKKKKQLHSKLLALQTFFQNQVLSLYCSQKRKNGYFFIVASLKCCRLALSRVWFLITA